MVCLVLQACAAEGSQASAREIDAEIARIEAALETLKSAELPEQLREALSANSARVARARAAKSPGLRLYRLRDAFVDVETLTFMTEQKAAGRSLDAIAALWKDQRAYVEAPAAVAKRSLLENALVEAGSNRAQKLFGASLAYARVTDPTAGLYYVSEARANRRFADFVASLPAAVERDEVAPGTESLRKAWTDLEGEALAVFEKDPAGRSAITPSARLKETRELIDRGWNAGAALVMLETRLELAKRGSSATYGRPSASRSDSLRALWAAAAAEEADRANAALIETQVLPLYDFVARRSP